MYWPSHLVAGEDESLNRKKVGSYPRAKCYNALVGLSPTPVIEVTSEVGGYLLPTFDLKSYARRGAEVRLGELKEEMSAIYAAFPDLRRGRAATPNGDSSPPPRRKRRRMSAAQRKAVGDRMRKYWAARRKVQEK